MRLRWRLYRDAEPRRGVAAAAMLAGTFAALALVTRLVCNDQAGNSAFWPANAALVVAILVLPRRLSAATALVCFTCNLLLNRLTSYTPVDSVLFSALNVGVSYGVAFLTRSLCGAATDLTRFRRLATFAAIAFVSAAAEAVLGELVRRPLLGMPVRSFDDGLQWTLCDGLGLVLATPPILMAARSARRGPAGHAGAAERWLLLGAACLLCLAGFAYGRTPLFLLVYPALILTAFRAGPAWVLMSVLLTSVIASGMTAHGFGPIAVLSRTGNLLRQDMMQPYLASLFLAAVPANNALGELGRAARRLQRLKAALEHSATHDSLTTLPNRALFRRRLAASLQAGSARAVFFIDLDNFKQVNDSLGHQAGDELLRVFSARLARALPERAMAARFGGDEFALLLGRGGAERVDAVCEAVVAAARAGFDLASGQVYVSASVGVALAGDTEGAEAGELMRRADIALYAVKAAGRDGYRVFSDTLDDPVREGAALERDLRAALDGAGGLAVQYQMKMGADGAPRGVDATLRWTHPRRGVIPMSEWLAIAEETGLIVDLGARVFAEAAAFAQRWPALRVAVPVSAVQLRHPDFVAETVRVFRAAGLGPERMELAVKQVALGDAVHPMAGRLAALRSAGLGIALVDFDAGYSALRHVHRFAVDRVAIDPCFVRRLGDDAEAAAIVQAVIHLGHAMGLRVTAEGVETALQRDTLVAAGVDELQGHFVGRPAEEAVLAEGLLGARLVAV
jgi:diguanylate cyclase (GGDEF)-like protein